MKEQGIDLEEADRKVLGTEDEKQHTEKDEIDTEEDDKDVN